MADILRRDMRLNPVVIPHGIDAEDWPGPSDKHAGYILWAKGHVPGVCDHTVINSLAEMMPDLRFVATYGNASHNVEITGRLPFDVMQKTLAVAGAYLATTKETFGIQTLEAMACGIPVVGYNFGGTADIVVHGQTGWLADPGDLEGLVEGIKWSLDNRHQLGINARAVIENRFSWEGIAKKVHDLYSLVIDDKRDAGIKVSIIIPCYNYETRVARAIESALSQDFAGAYEIIVVDDGSTDSSGEVIDQYKDRVTVAHIENGGVADARNFGIRLAHGEYIACLDADDAMVPEFLSLLVPVLDADRGLGISYGSLQINFDESSHNRKGTWPGKYDYGLQATGNNCVPSACVFRKEAWARAGGYRSQYTPAEDAELWLRITSVGYKARKTTEEITYIYDAHAGSLSRSIETPDWHNDKPWSLDNALIPFAAQTNGHGSSSYAVRNYDDPWVSVIIPVGPDHGTLVGRALDSIWLQSIPDWEVIVVNDSGSQLYCDKTGRLLSDVYPFAKIIDVDHRNVSISRNDGADIATSDLLVFLDADDWLLKDYLKVSIDAYNEDVGAYTYTDWLSFDGTNMKHGARDFDCDGMKLQALHTVTALVPKTWHYEVGGFDAELGVAGWEDWDYFLKIVVVNGHCGRRIPEPLVVYDATAGTRREYSLANKDELVSIIKERYANTMCKRCSSTKSRARTLPSMPMPIQGMLASAPNSPRLRVSPASGLPQRNSTATFTVPTAIRSRGVMIPMNAVTRSGNGGVAKMDDVKVRENSGNSGAHRVRGAATRRKYGRKKHGQVFDMDPRDQKAQPHVYILVMAGNAPVQNMPVRPEVPSVSVPVDRSIQPPPVPVGVPVPQEPAVAVAVAQNDNVPVEPATGFNVDEAGIDISILPLPLIKRLELDEDSAADAYLAEMDGGNREDVLAYLEKQAGDVLEFEE